MSHTIPADNTHPLTPAQVEAFDRDGYLFVENLLDAEETAMLLTAAREDHEMLNHAFSMDDTAGRKTRISLWNHPGDDIYGKVASCHKIVDACEQLLDDEVYHYHSKMLLKEPRVGGAWEWHQDYGYWYHNGCLFPDMISCYIALDPATKANGCMQIIPGSHKLGRIEHGRYGKQTGADPARIEAILKRFPVVHAEMAPGTGLYFHGNTLHCSAQNNSDNSRWAMICCYNAKHNDPVKEHHHPRYTPLRKSPNEAIKQTGARVSTAAQTSWLDPEKDETIGAEEYDK